jgi:hypothetical protein
MNLEDWKNISEADFYRIFAKSPLKRAGFERIKEILNFEFADL